MILEKETFDKLGYWYKDLAKTNPSKILCYCDTCKIIFERINSSLKKSSSVITLCNSCTSKKIVNSESYKEKIKKTSLARYGCEDPRKSKEAVAKRHATNLKKFGSISPFSNKDVREKIKSTNLERFGFISPFSNKDVREKIKSTNLERFGCTHPLGNKAILAKISKTNLERFGHEKNFANKEIREKIKKTMIANHGCEFPMQNDEIKKRIKATNLQRYGFENTLSNPEIKSKARATMIRRHGVEFPMQSDELQEKIRETNIARYGTPYPPFKFGKTQKEIQDWLLSLGLEFESNHSILSGKEIDLYNEELKLGIEYCGLHWHNENSPQPREDGYHYNKYIQCFNLAVRLITIYENEWLEREFQVKSYLRAVLNKNENKIFARKCSVQEIDKGCGNEFIEKYHIQGSNSLGLHYSGLFYNEDLVAVMSFGRHHRKNGVITLDRLCFKENYTIVGGASRLFAFLLCLSNAQVVVSWSDNRWSQGNVYKELGFELDAELQSDYAYVVKNRAKLFSKQSQSKKASKCPEGLTELQWANQRGLSRIWDCGKKRWVFNKK